MKRPQIILILLLFFTKLSLLSNYNSYIVKFQDTKGADNLQNQNIKIKPVINSQISNKYRTQQQSKDGSLLNDYFVVSSVNKVELEKYLVQQKFSFIEPNYIFKIEQSTPNDPQFKNQWGNKHVKSEKAKLYSKGSGVIIGVIDTGIDSKHIDIVDNLWINSGEDVNKNGKFDDWSNVIQINGVYGDINNIDDDLNGFIDDLIGYDFVDQQLSSFGDTYERDVYPEDEHDHGTLVSGIISAIDNNELDISGIAVDSKIMTLRAFDASGNGEVDDIAASIIYGAINGAKVLNCSFGELYDSQLLKEAINFAYSLGCVIIASSGNNNDYFKHYPSDYNNTISVGGTTIDYEKYGHGNYGSKIDISAPAEDIVSLSRGGGTKTKSGTSFSAPYVSAAAALLLEKNSDYNPDIIKNIIKSSAYDLGKIGWDSLYGAGLLDINAMINYKTKPLIKISEPLDGTEMIKNTNSKGFYIIGTVVHELFDSYELNWGLGLLPEKMNIFKINNEQVINDTLGFLSYDSLLSNFRKFNFNTNEWDTIFGNYDTTYTLALKIILKNRNTIESRIYLNINKIENSLKFSNISFKPIYYNEKKVLLINVKSNRASKFTVEYGEANGNSKNMKDLKYFDTFHEALIDDLESNKKYNFRLSIISENGIAETIDTSFIFERKNFINDDFELKYTLNGRHYLNNKYIDYDNSKMFFFNDYSDLNIGQLFQYKFFNGTFTKIDSLADIWILKNIGNFNGNQFPDLMTINSGKNNIMEFVDGKALKNSIFKSYLMSDIYFEHFNDFNNDGKDEIILKLKKSYASAKIENNKLIPIDTCEIPSNFRGISVWVGSEYGNFDNDEDKELAFLNEVGCLFIYNQKDGFFTLDYADTVIKDNSHQYLDAGDFDGDGVNELLYLSFGTKEFTNINNDLNPYWTAKILDFDGTSYLSIWEESFYGVKTGSFGPNYATFRNGLTQGDLNGDGTPEAIISVFPNLYVFDIKNNHTLWHFPAVLSNGAAVVDLDNNERNEIGFSGYNNTYFFELPIIPKRPSTPTNFSSYVYNDSTCVFRWNKSTNADYYQIGELIDNESVSMLNLKITADSLRFIDPTQKGKILNFTLIACNDSMEIKNSYFTSPFEVHFHNPIQRAIISKVIAENLTLIVKFDGEITDELINPYNFFIINKSLEQFKLFPETALKSGDSSIILSFNKIIPSSKYSLKCNSFKDKYGTWSSPIEIEFDILQSEKKEALFIKKLDIWAKSLIEIQFSEILDNNSATNISNYKIAPYGEIISISINEVDSTKIMALLSSHFWGNNSRGINYIITAKDVYSNKGNKITDGIGNSIGFVFASEDNSEAYAYPQPCSISKNEKITFGGLTNIADVTICYLNGIEIIKLNENDGNGGIEWDFRDKTGLQVLHGIYLLKINSISNGVKNLEEVKKFVLIP